MSALVQKVGCKLDLTEGQVYTAAIGLFVALATAIGGIPPTLVDRVRPAGVARPLVDPTGSVAPATSAGPPAPAPVSAPDGFSLPFDPAPTFPDGGSFGGGSFPGDGGNIGGGGGDFSPPRPPVGTVDTFASVPAPGAPEGIAVGNDGRVFVATNNSGAKPVVMRFTGDGALEASVTVEAIEAGFGVRGLALPRATGGNVVYALAARPAAVFRVDVGLGTVASYAGIPDVPPCIAVALAGPCELSPVDNAPEPRAAVFGADGALYVADRGQALVWRVAPGGGEVRLAHQSPEFVSPDGLSGITVDSTERLVVTVAQSVTDAGGGTVYRLGDAAPTKVASTATGDRPVGIAGGRSGRLYVALAGAGRVVVLDQAGAEQARYPGATDAPFDTPVGVAFRGEDLLVTEQAPTRPPAGRVVRIVVEDRGVLS
ncbi:MAG TPA: hypothetical protein VM938_02395 [Acidimicrobiales bacterium]|nr:hypothetical protein [Acidimicrobiales bacterium]